MRSTFHLTLIQETSYQTLIPLYTEHQQSFPSQASSSPITENSAQEQTHPIYANMSKIKSVFN